MQGTIKVLAPPDLLLGQRLDFHRYGETSPLDLPNPPGALRGHFQFSTAVSPGKGPATARVPLEVEWRTELGLIDVATEHDVRVARYVITGKSR